MTRANIMEVGKAEGEAATATEHYQEAERRLQNLGATRLPPAERALRERELQAEYEAAAETLIGAQSQLDAAQSAEEDRRLRTPSPP